MSPAETLWLSGLALGLALGIPLGVILAVLLPQAARFLRSRVEHDRSS